MRLADFDFLAPTPRPWAGLALAVAALSLLAAVLHANWQTARVNQAARAALANADARQQAPARPTEADRVRLAQTAAVSGELGAPWSDLMGAFERHSRADVGLLKLEPDARAGTVRVLAQARHTKAMFAYLRALEGDPHLEQVTLLSHQREREVGGQPLRFSLQARWRASALPTPGARPKESS